MPQPPRAVSPMPDARQPREQWGASATFVRADSGAFPILVVDDEPGIRSMVERVLSRVGHPVRGARDVAAAITALDECHFAAILTDLAMPGRPGLALVDEVESRRLSTPVILMTGSPEDLDGSDPRVERLAGMVTKPFDVRALRSLISTVIGISQRTRPDAPGCEARSVRVAPLPEAPRRRRAV